MGLTDRVQVFGGIVVIVVVVGLSLNLIFGLPFVEIEAPNNLFQRILGLAIPSGILFVLFVLHKYWGGF
ncbi:hypothetical protein OB920_13160 [Halobacteria archaeon HArc-gm2]|nr:hypothetical protein [Halobacteria archaeon HArc-gm2]